MLAGLVAYPQNLQGAPVSLRQGSGFLAGVHQVMLVYPPRDLRGRADEGLDYPVMEMEEAWLWPQKRREAGSLGLRNLGDRGSDK